jgi:hypothetical protein
MYPSPVPAELGKEQPRQDEAGLGQVERTFGIQGYLRMSAQIARDLTARKVFHLPCEEVADTRPETELTSVANTSQ